MIDTTNMIKVPNRKNFYITKEEAVAGKYLISTDSIGNDRIYAITEDKGEISLKQIYFYRHHKDELPLLRKSRYWVYDKDFVNHLLVEYRNTSIDSLEMLNKKKEKSSKVKEME